MKNAIVVGLGQTGLSCVEFLLKQSYRVCVVDTRKNPPNLKDFQTRYPQIQCHCAMLPDFEWWPSYTLVLSPGVDPDELFIRMLKERAVSVTSDVALFLAANQAPVVAITGSNGKSTVTTLVGDMIRQAGLKPAVVGNIGVPVLSVLNRQEKVDVIVMELSSFQLDLLQSVPVKVATITNISPDHLDRYPTFEAYIQSKQKITQQAEYVVVNIDDANTIPDTVSGAQINVTLHSPKELELGMTVDNEGTWLCYGQDRLINTKDIALRGRHNHLNALIALAIGLQLELPIEAMKQSLKNFTGLAHRCEWIASHNNISWINDSKATNVGASIAAIEGLGQQIEPQAGKIILLLGGQAKGQDFTALIAPIKRFCRQLIVMGEHAHALAALLGDVCQTHFVEDMKQAVHLAQQCATANDIVLLSPACASFDQYQNFEHRGECFKQAVIELHA